MGLFGRLHLSRSDDADTTRSAAGRAALEAVVFAPASTLPGSGVEWRVDGDDRLVARAERAFGDFIILSRISVGWWFGTPRYKPFFEAEITDARPTG